MSRVERQEAVAPPRKRLATRHGLPARHGSLGLRVRYQEFPTGFGLFLKEPLRLS